MPAQLTFHLDKDLGKLARDLQEFDAANSTRLRRDLAAEMRKIGDRVVMAEQAAIRGTKIRGVKKSGGLRVKRGKPLPKGSGTGIREPIADAIIRRNRLTGKSVGVEIRVSKGKLPAAMRNLPSLTNKGKIRHPLFGDFEQWYDQVVTPAHWWTRTRKEQESAVREDILRVGKEFLAEVRKVLNQA